MKQRIVTFDEATAQKLAAHDPELREGSPLLEALAGDRPSIVILPASDPNQAVIARVTPRGANADPRVGRPADRYEAGGFLGLSDEAVFDEEKKRR
jgi:hypothetical protein